MINYENQFIYVTYVEVNVEDKWGYSKYFEPNDEQIMTEILKNLEQSIQVI